MFKLMSGSQKRKYSPQVDVFRFTPESRHQADIAGGPVSANKRLMHRSKQHLYSIILPARAAGISRPRAIETANVKPHLTLRAKKAFISADVEMNRCSYPDPVLRIRGGNHAEASKLTARLLVLGHFLGKQRQ